MIIEELVGNRPADWVILVLLLAFLFNKIALKKIKHTATILVIYSASLWLTLKEGYSLDPGHYAALIGLAIASFYSFYRKLKFEKADKILEEEREWKLRTFGTEK